MLGSMTAPARRESVPVTSAQATTLEQLLKQASPERAALDDLVPEVGTSRAGVLHALLSVGMEAVREKARERAYTELAAQSGADDEHEIRTGRRRQLSEWREGA